MCVLKESGIRYIISLSIESSFQKSISNPYYLQMCPSYDFFISCSVKFLPLNSKSNNTALFGLNMFFTCY